MRADLLYVSFMVIISAAISRARSRAMRDAAGSKMPLSAQVTPGFS
jgi:hypothetical protein